MNLMILCISLSIIKMSSKIKTDINRDKLWQLVDGTAGYRPVSQISIDETWSALRFRESDKVNSKKK
ncbi:hypothetical protein [Effusibacillus consociatus]|uniref:Uncharacterized protein n=1 Tax=Effusibacillus consociatus TaxID=1117041 RepID=A0ABV9PX06_9BACL